MKKGFTLIELAMVLIVVGLLMGGAFQMMKTMGEKARSTEAKNTLEAAKEAVIGYVMNHSGVLPLDQATFNTLGFRGTGNTDINYVSDGALQICTSSATLLNTRDQNDQNTSSVAFVLAIAGENMNVQTGRQGNTVWFHPRNIALNVDDETTVLNRPEPYDDLYVQVTLDELRAMYGCQPLKIINPQLPVGDINASYRAQIISEGGNGTYTYTFSPATVNGYTFPTDGNISHTWTTGISPTPINITVSSGTNLPATRKYVLQIN